VLVVTSTCDAVLRLLQGVNDLIADYLRLTLGPLQNRVCAQMFPFWRRLTYQMMHHQVGRTVVHHSLFQGTEPPCPEQAEGLAAG